MDGRHLSLGLRWLLGVDCGAIVLFRMERLRSVSANEILRIPRPTGGIFYEHHLRYRRPNENEGGPGLAP